LLHRLRPATRFAVIAGIFLVIAPLAFITPEISASITDFMVNTLHKDTGLTGRDVLWRKAFELIREHPLLGLGYDVFWMSENTDARGILYEQGVQDAHGYHFHNTYIQLAVDLGIVDSGLFAVTFLAAVVAAIRQYFMHPSVATTFFLVMLLLFLGRSPTEVLLGPLNGITVPFYMTIVFAFWRPSATGGWGEAEKSQGEAPRAWTGYEPAAWPLPAVRDAAQVIASRRSPFG
jgi:exopolysaccharide production protein ExoQ